MATACVLSDLHMFCRRSTVDAHMPAIHEAIARSDICVLLGDVIDFRWTTFPSIEETVGPALVWLDGLLARFPNCRFEYVLGNHDAHGAFIPALHAFAAGQPRLRCHEFYLRLGASVFLHGDAAHRDMSKTEFEEDFRACWRVDTKKGAAMNWLYSVGFAFGVHTWVHRVSFPETKVLPRLTRYLDGCGLGAASGVGDVYFGHTHAWMSSVEYGGLRFHNPGAAMPGLRFEPLVVPVEKGAGYE